MSVYGQTAQQHASRTPVLTRQESRTRVVAFRPRAACNRPSKQQKTNPIQDGYSPSNLFDDLTNKGSSLAQVALGPGDTGLDDTRGGFLYAAREKIARQRPSSASSRSRDPPRGETAQRTWPRFRPVARPVLAGASLAIVILRNGVRVEEMVRSKSALGDVEE